MFPVLQKLREYTTRRAPFQEILKVVILCEKTEGHKTMSKITNELKAWIRIIHDIKNIKEEEV